MSFEQMVADLTAALRDNTAALRAFTSPTITPESTVEAPAKRGPGRPPKTPPPAEAKSYGPANPGDAEGTVYYACDAHNTVAKFGPQDSLAAVVDRTKWVPITGAEFLAKQKALAERFPSAASAQTPTAASSPPTATPAAAPAASETSTKAPETLSFESVRAALLKVATDDPKNGRKRITDAIDLVGAKTIPQLDGKSGADLAKVMAAIAPAAEVDPLFG